jgi:hypothetical protein
VITAYPSKSHAISSGKFFKNILPRGSTSRDGHGDTGTQCRRARDAEAGRETFAPGTAGRETFMSGTAGGGAAGWLGTGSCRPAGGAGWPRLASGAGRSGPGRRSGEGRGGARGAGGPFHHLAGPCTSTRE